MKRPREACGAASPRELTDPGHLSNQPNSRVRGAHSNARSSQRLVHEVREREHTRHIVASTSRCGCHSIVGEAVRVGERRARTDTANDRGSRLGQLGFEAYVTGLGEERMRISVGTYLPAGGN